MPVLHARAAWAVAHALAGIALQRQRQLLGFLHLRSDVIASASPKEAQHARSARAVMDDRRAVELRTHVQAGLRALQVRAPPRDLFNSH